VFAASDCRLVSDWRLASGVTRGGRDVCFGEWEPTLADGEMGGGCRPACAGAEACLVVLVMSGVLAVLCDLLGVVGK